MTRERALAIGVIELLLMALLVVGGYTSHLPDLPRPAAIVVYGLVVLGGMDGLFRLVDVATWPPNTRLLGMRRFYLIAFGALIPGLLLDEFKLVSFLRGGPCIIAAGLIYLGVTLPVWLVEHPRIQWLRDWFGDTGIRVLYIGLGLLFLVLAFFAKRLA